MNQTTCPDCYRKGIACSRHKRVFEGYESDDRPSAIAFSFTSKELLGLLRVASMYRTGKMQS